MVVGVSAVNCVKKPHNDSIFLTLCGLVDFVRIESVNPLVKGTDNNVLIR